MVVRAVRVRAGLVLVEDDLSFAASAYAAHQAISISRTFSSSPAVIWTRKPPHSGQAEKRSASATVLPQSGHQPAPGRRVISSRALRRACRARPRRSRIRAPRARRAQRADVDDDPRHPLSAFLARRLDAMSTMLSVSDISCNGRLLEPNFQRARGSNEHATRRNARRSWPSANRRIVRRALRKPEAARRTERRPRPPSRASLRRRVSPSTPIGRRRLAIAAMFNPVATPELAFLRPNAPRSRRVTWRQKRRKILDLRQHRPLRGRRAKAGPAAAWAGRAVKLKPRRGGARPRLTRGATVGAAGIVCAAACAPSTATCGTRIESRRFRGLNSPPA